VLVVPAAASIGMLASAHPLLKGFKEIARK
jgi:hypothetical protein